MTRMDKQKRNRASVSFVIVNTLIAWFVVAIAITLTTYAVNYYRSEAFWQSLLAGLHNTLFDMLLIGVFIYWLNKRIEIRNEIRRYQEQLDLWRRDGSRTAINTIQMNIRRLIEHGVHNIDLSGCFLQNIDLSGLALSQSKFIEAQCFEAIFRNADLSHTVMDKANLKRADLSEADLTDASLRGTMLEYADLRKANLCGADFSGAVVSNVDWREAIYDEGTRFSYEPDKSLMKFAKSSES